MNDIPYLDNAMWAFDEAGLPYPEVPADDAPVFAAKASSEAAVPHETETEITDISVALTPRQSGRTMLHRRSPNLIILKQPKLS